MSLRSWEVFVASVDSLKHAEYRFGDFAERTTHKIMDVAKTKEFSPHKIMDVAKTKDFTERTGRKLLEVAKGSAAWQAGRRMLQKAEGNSPSGRLADTSPGARLADKEGSSARDNSASPAPSDDSDPEAGEASSKSFVEDPESGTSGTRSKKLGSVTVEVQVGNVKKRLQPFKVLGEVVVEVGGTVLVPEPAEGERMVVRVLRVGHMQEDSLIGECEISEAAESTVRMPLFRKTGKGKTKGFISLAISPVSADSRPVSLDQSLPDVATSSNPIDFLKSKRNRFADKYIAGSNASTPAGRNASTPVSPGLASSFQQPLLDKKPVEAPRSGECVVAIEAIRELTKRTSRPSIVVKLDGQEVRTDAEQLSHACEADLTFKFTFSSMQNNLCIYCYDDHGRSRSAAVGRIVLPLTGFLWGVGEPPRFDLLCKAATPKVATFTKRVDAQFMPLSAGGDGQNDPKFERFTPAKRRKDGKAVPGTGLSKKKAFGLLSLRIELTLEPPLKHYLKSVTSQLHTITNMGGESEQEQTAQPQTLDLMGVMQSNVVQQAVRNCERLEALMKAPSRGFLRWVRAKPWHGPAAGGFWLIFCLTGLFPPPAWAVPVYVWAMFLINGIFVAIQREEDWSNSDQQAYPVWNEELEMATPSMSELMANFTKGICTLERSTRIMLGFMERLLNALAFADGVATVFFALCGGLLALALSILALFWSQLFDPTGAWFFGLAGFGACLVLSHPTKKRVVPSGPNQDALARVEKLNRVLGCVPDMDEVAHRYIASRVQCAAMNIPLKVSIIAATGLRNADHMPGQGVSDPYCVCTIPGKKDVKICTQVIDDNLNPVWNYEEVITCFTQGDSLLFKVYDKDPGSAGDFLGKAKLASAEFYPKGFNGEVPLQEAGKGIKASLKLAIEVLAEQPKTAGP